MRAMLIAAALVLAVWAGLLMVSDAEWVGIDVGIVGKVAEEAGRPPWTPFINTDQGDLLLFVFLVAGAAGGFVMGYYFRELFGAPGKQKKEAKQ